MKRYTTLAIGILLLFLLQCGTRSNSTSMIRRPFPEISVPAQTFTFLAEEGGEFTTEKGSRVIIPAHALEDSQGNPVSGEVEIDFLEFHSLAEIMASGIPMKYEGGDFQSAGMFSIEGYAGEEKLSIKPGAAVTVEMATIDYEAGYNFYVLDTISGTWTELSKNSVTDQQPVNVNDSLQQMLDYTYMPEPTEAKPSDFVFDLSVDYNDYPELKEFHGIMWAYAGTDASEDPRQRTDLEGISWGRASLEPVDRENNIFRLKLSSASGKIFKTIVRPVLRGKSYEAAREKYENYMTARDERIKAEGDRLLAMEQSQNITRTFEVSGFGIYNCDRLYTEQTPVMANAYYTLNGRTIAPEVKLYLANITDNVMIYQYQSALLKLDPAKENRLLAVMKDGSVAWCSAEKLRELTANTGESAVEITLEKLSVEWEDVESVEKFLGCKTI